MTFNEVIEQLRDGKAYNFTNPGLLGSFYKAPFPEDEGQTRIDDACSAITYWIEGKPSMPTLMLYDFDRDDWEIEEASQHPSI